MCALGLTFLAAGASLLAGCGGGDRPAPGRQVFRAQAGEACKRYQARLDALSRRAARASAASRPQILRDASELIEEVTNALSRVPPSDDAREDFDRLKQSFTRVSELYARAAEGFERGDAAAEDVLVEGTAEARRAKTIANELDLPACGGRERPPSG